jgi:hypothetical protein
MDTDDQVNTGSGAYLVGAIAGTAASMAITGGGSAEAEGLEVSAEAHAAQQEAASAGRSWTTQRRAFWKAEAGSEGAAERWGAGNVDRMNRGLAPQIEGRSVELHHTPIPQRAGGTRVVPMTPAQHAQVDPFRHP